MEAVLKYLEFIPAYIIDLVAFLTSPKAFLHSRNSGIDANWPNALRFFAFSAVFAFVLNQFSGWSPFLNGQNVFFNLTKAVMIWTVCLLFGAAAIKAAWRLVGGRAPFDSVLLTHLYVFSFAILVVNCGSLAIVGLVANIAPEYYRESVNTIREGGMPSLLRHRYEHNATDVYLTIVFIGGFLTLFIMTTAWFIATWGAYRELSRLSRLRSFVAFVFSVLLFLPVLVLIFLITTLVSLKA